MSIAPLGSVIRTERIQSKLRRIRGWELDEERNVLVRTYELPSFRAALAFVQFVGEVAESFDHHPDIDVRYRKVTLALSTHSAGGITERDFELVRSIDGYE